MTTDDWTDLEQVALPLRAVGHGYAQASVGTLVARGRWEAMPFAELERSGVAHVSCLTVEARILLVEADEPAVSLEHATPAEQALPGQQFGANTWVVDGRDGSGSVSFPSLRVLLAGDKVRLQSRRPLDLRLPLAQLSLPAPDWGLLGQWAVEPWVSALVHRLAALGPLREVAAIAAYARYWRPARDPAAVQRFITEGGPWQAARSWFAALDPQLRDGVYRLGVSEAAALDERLNSLCETVCAREESAQALVVAWLHRREDLACVHSLARRLNERSKAWQQLDRSLGSLDESARSWASMFVDAGVSRDERLWAVTRADPIAWWGKVGA